MDTKIICPIFFSIQDPRENHHEWNNSESSIHLCLLSYDTVIFSSTFTESLYGKEVVGGKIELCVHLIISAALSSYKLISIIIYIEAPTVNVL
jgi:hypothetical protein